MKKIFLSVLALCAFGAVNAQDIVELAPVNVENGEGTIEFYVSADLGVAGLQTFFYVPEGWTVDRANVVKGAGIQDHSYTITKKKDDLAGYSKYQLMVASSTKSELADDEVCTVKVTTDAAEGVYPILLKSVKVSAVDDEGLSVNTTTADVASYATVGDAKDQTYAPVGVIGPRTNEALEANTAITTLDLAGVTGVKGELVYTVGRAVAAPASLTADVKVVAGLNGGQYGSLKSPVALPGVKCYTFSSVEGNVATFVEAADVPANEVVIIDQAVEATVNGATLASVENGTATAGSYYIAPDGSELRRAAGTPAVPALRGVWTVGGGSNLRIALDTTTGIKMIGNADEVFGNTYDLQGRQVENAKNGVYVVNGKKQFVK